MSSFFSNNSSSIKDSFNTPIGKLIEASINPNDSYDNLEVYFEICDFINNHEAENSKDAIRAIRKMLTIYSSNHSWTTVMKILQLLETCSNNCTRRFQLQLNNKDFLHEFKALLQPKLNPPLNVQEKVLYLIQVFHF
jgi:hypothetical protein